MTAIIGMSVKDAPQACIVYVVWGSRSGGYLPPSVGISFRGPGRLRAWARSIL